MRAKRGRMVEFRVVGQLGSGVIHETASLLRGDETIPREECEDCCIILLNNNYSFNVFIIMQIHVQGVSTNS